MDALAASGSPCAGPTSECRSPMPWPRITRTGSTAWSSPRPPSRVSLPHLPCSSPQLQRRLWHLAFNQLPNVNEQLVTGREDIFFGAEFDASAGTKKLPDDAVRYYIDTLASDPDPPARQLRVLPRDPHHHRAERAAQDPAADPARPGDRRSGKLRRRGREHDEARRGRRADPGLPGCGHWVAEQAPEQLLAALTAFLAPYRDGTARGNQRCCQGTGSVANGHLYIDHQTNQGDPPVRQYRNPSGRRGDPPVPGRDARRSDRRPAAAHRRDALAQQGARRRPVAGRAAGDDSGARPLLGDRLRLARGARRD